MAFTGIYARFYINCVADCKIVRVDTEKNVTGSRAEQDSNGKLDDYLPEKEIS